MCCEQFFLALSIHFPWDIHCGKSRKGNKWSDWTEIETFGKEPSVIIWLRVRGNYLQSSGLERRKSHRNKENIAVVVGLSVSIIIKGGHIADITMMDRFLSEAAGAALSARFTRIRLAHWRWRASAIESQTPSRMVLALTTRDVRQVGMSGMQPHKGLRGFNG